MHVKSHKNTITAMNPEFHSRLKASEVQNLKQNIKTIQKKQLRISSATVSDDSLSYLRLEETSLDGTKATTFCP